MNHEDKIRLGAMGLGAALLPLLLTLFLDWSPWIGALLAVALLLGAGWAGIRLVDQRTRELERARAQAYQAPPPPPVVVPQEERVSEAAIDAVPVPSGQPDYHFLFSAKVRWTLTGMGNPMAPDPTAALKRLILDRVCELAATRSPMNPELVENAIAADLSVRRRDHSGSFLGWADDVRLTLSEDDRKRLDKLAALRKEQQVWEHERGFEIDKREYLGTDVLKTTGSAVVWWLAQDHTKVVETVDLIGTLSKLTDAANDRADSALWPGPIATGPFLPAIPAEPETTGPWGTSEIWPSEQAEPEPDPGVALVDEVFGATRSGQRDLFADQLATLVEKHGRSDLADRMRRTLAGESSDDPQGLPSAEEPDRAEEPTFTPHASDQADEHEPILSSSDPGTYPSVIASNGSDPA